MGGGRYRVFDDSEIIRNRRIEHKEGFFRVVLSYVGGRGKGTCKCDAGRSDCKAEGFLERGKCLLFGWLKANEVTGSQLTGKKCKYGPD